jgi:hypothetical protein
MKNDDGYDDGFSLLALMHAAEAIDSGHWLMKCPAHQGASSASLEVRLCEGRYALRCVGGCKPERVIAAALDLVQAKVDGREDVSCAA